MAMGLEDYPGRTPRRLVLAYQVPNTKREIMFDPSAFYFGHFRRWTQKQRRDALRAWKTYWSTQQEFPRLFDVSFEQRVYTHEKDRRGWKKQEQDLRTVKIADLEWAIQHEIRARQSRIWKAAHLWNGKGDDELFGYGILQESETPFTGSTATTAHVRADSSARNSNVPKYRLISIDNLFGAEGHIITDASGSSEDFPYSEIKAGHRRIVVIGKDHAALMDFAHQHPEKIRGHNSKKGTAFLPFDFTASFSHEGIRAAHPEFFPSLSAEEGYQRPAREVLMIDALLFWLFNNATVFEMSKRFMQMPFIMDTTVIEHIRDASFCLEVLPQGYATPDIPVEKVRQLRKMYTEIHKGLTKQGYSLKGYTLEFAGTPNETIAYNYESITGTVRILFHPEYAFPPLVQYQQQTQMTERGLETMPDNRHPINLLARGERLEHDTWTKQREYMLVEVPDIFIPGEIIPDYRTAIAAHYEGGINQFKANVTAKYMYGSEREQAMGRKLRALSRD